MDEPREQAEARAEQVRASWQYRAIAVLKSHTTIAGCILLAALKRRPSNPPFFEGQAVINRVGGIYADLYIDGLGRAWAQQPVTSVTALREKFNRVADDLKLSDEERKEMFLALQSWIRKDERPEKDRGL